MAPQRAQRIWGGEGSVDIFNTTQSIKKRNVNMEPAMELRTLADARVSTRVLYDLFCRQLADARRYGYGTWMLALWTEDVWYGWGLGSDAASLRALVEADAHVRVVGSPKGLRVTTSRQGTPLDRARAPSAQPAPRLPPAPLAMRSSRANTM